MKKKGICASRYCKNKVKGNRNCSSCRSRQARQKNPVKYCYLNLKHNAGRRAIVFDLTFEQFTQFCYATNYLAGKGKTRTSYSIDRIDNAKGYTLDNIRVITLAENSRKGSKVLNYDYQTNTAIVTNSIINNANEGNYF